MKTGAPAAEPAAAPLPAPPRPDPGPAARPRAGAAAAALGLAAAALLALWWSVGRPGPAEVRQWAALDILVVLRWWVVAAALGLAAAGWTRPLTAHLPDRGWALDRVAGLVGASYLAWLVGTLHILPYDRTPAWLWVGLLAALYKRTPIELFSPKLDQLLMAFFQRKHLSCAFCVRKCNQICCRCERPVCIHHGRVRRHLLLLCPECGAPGNPPPCDMA